MKNADFTYRYLQYAWSDDDMVIMEYYKDKNIKQVRYGKGYYKTNIKILDEELLETFKEKWELWKTLIPLCETKLEWWIEIKERIRKLFIERSIQKARETKSKINALMQQLEFLR